MLSVLPRTKVAMPVIPDTVTCKNYIYAGVIMNRTRVNMNHTYSGDGENIAHFYGWKLFAIKIFNSHLFQLKRQTKHAHIQTDRHTHTHTHTHTYTHTNK